MNDTDGIRLYLQLVAVRFRSEFYGAKLMRTKYTTATVYRH